MDNLSAKLLAHLHQKAFRDALEMVKRDPVLLTMEGDDFWFPLHHAIKNNAPCDVVASFTDEWLQIEDFQALCGMNLVHCACYYNAPLDVVRYLSSLFPDSLTSQTTNLIDTPLMYALEAKRDHDVIKCVSYSNIEYIGDFDPWHNKVHRAIVEQYMVDDTFVDSLTAMFRLEHKDPTLTSLVISDGFFSMFEKPPDDWEYARNMNRLYQNTFDSVMDAVSSHPYLTAIILIMDAQGLLWNNRQQKTALINLIRDKPSITSVAIVTSETDLTRVGEVLQNFTQVKSVSISNESGIQFSGNRMANVCNSLNTLPLLEHLELRRVSIYPSDAKPMYRKILKKTSMRWVCMSHTGIDHWLSSQFFVRVMKDNPKLEHLQYMSLFGDNPPPNPSFFDPTAADWQAAIDLELATITAENFTRGSIKQFMNKIKLCDQIEFNGHHSDLQFIVDIVDANEHDGNNECYPQNPTDHLYSLLRAKPDFIKGCSSTKSPKSNKRPKLI
jgi:hypothetical protein